MSGDNLARWASLRGADPDALRAASKDLAQVLSGPGWQFVHRWLASQQQTTLNYLLRQPGNDRADTYALKKAHAAGYLEGLQHAYETPQAVLEIAKQVAERQQQAAEAAEE
jgi:hypothetical protein